ncbi:hypothetical protein [Alkalicoccobacillus murimartini]|uniref:ABC-type Na+ efflux pump permease subunit n=1 Tax=Alkalicoccobacillus murimartini TaxID=171685 RepID=A0ABT9YHH2_9BACI|nr:hypothetical protein [Alkalicoccobacillus murimartini]MDQ0207058.1 ABC-type Na+ efflux pump permease subunit [Alkalicoccobacillus murimartini]
MIKKKHLTYLAPMWIMVFFFVLDQSWWYIGVMGASIFIGSIIGYKTGAGIWGASARTQHIFSKWSSILWIALMTVFLFIDLDLPLWRQLVAVGLIFITGLFDYIDSYLWYKKEKKEEEDLEAKRVKEDEYG